MANGFIQPDGRTKLEDIGERFFSDFVWCYMFQDIEKDEYGNIEGCKMHDLASSVAEEEFFTLIFLRKGSCLRKFVIRPPVGMRDFHFPKNS
ncbi:hypothetical protein Sjap_006224 [Stephania japonica]|uniref:Disease resistance protein winged helix domain-containing protein n=1 Tax=Stephania japonica TaxID=461633 RepID=A0AAP0PML3_9MAGN